MMQKVVDETIWSSKFKLFINFNGKLGKISWFLHYFSEKRRFVKHKTNHKLRKESITQKPNPSNPNFSSLPYTIGDPYNLTT